MNDTTFSNNKRPLLLALAWSFFFLLPPIKAYNQSASQSNIKNGYESELVQWNHQLKGISYALNSSKTTPCQRKVLTKILKYTEVYRNQLQKSYDRTSEVLRTFKENDPELFEQVNNIRDKDGNVTDVYIKVINDYGAENGIYGSTNLNQSAHDIDAYTSPYGDYSVLVKVAECPKVLSLLAHEFGHVIYQVPNLASYVMYYQQAYGASGNSITGRGHLPDDPSHLSVKRVLKSFHRKSRKGP